MILALGDNERSDVMDNSILNTAKKLIGSEGCEHFDTDIIIHTNTALMVLNQLGVGPEGFSIEDETATWDEFTADKKVLPLVKSYVPLKVKIIFDPPTSSVVMEAINATLSELEWRIQNAVETKENNS